MSLRFRRHYHLFLLLVLVTGGLWLAIGDQRILSYSTSQARSPEITSQNISNTIPLFDDQVVHSVQILMDSDEYQMMITTYQQTGQKKYFHADMILDGVRVNNVGVRLKGNSSLRTALGRGATRGMFGDDRPPVGGFNPPQPQAAPGGWQFPQNLPIQPGGGQALRAQERPNPGFNPPIQPGGNQPPQAVHPPAAEANPAPVPVSSSGKIPLMVKFDVFEAGQRYQGYSAMAIRTYGNSSDAAMLQEPITYYVFKIAGLVAPETAYAGVRINNESERLFTISEVINATYLDGYFPGTHGVLYKSEVGSELRYRGDDPSLYARSFTQQTRVNDADLAPLIDFMRFLSESDETTFEKELPQRLDVDSFAGYLAINNLVVNADSIAGMGNNYYLYYNEKTRQFSLLVWDGNESLGKMGGGQAANYDLYHQNTQGMRFPMRASNQLFTRFMANPTFKALYEQKLKSIYLQAFRSGAINHQIETYANLVRQVNEQRNLVSTNDYERAMSNTLNFIAQRMTYLSSTPLLGTLSTSAR